MFGGSGHRPRLAASMVALLLASSFFLSLAVTPAAHASGTVLASGNCISSGGAFTGTGAGSVSWSGSTCTVSGGTFYLNYNLQIDSGTTLTIAGGYPSGELVSGYTIDNYGSLVVTGGNIYIGTGVTATPGLEEFLASINNHVGGTVTVNNAGGVGILVGLNGYAGGIDNQGGTITVTNTWSASTCGGCSTSYSDTYLTNGLVINSTSTLVNTGTVTVQNHAGNGIDLVSGTYTNGIGGVATISNDCTASGCNYSTGLLIGGSASATNDGSVSLSATGSTNVVNAGIFDNYGGLSNSGTFSNSGTVYLECGDSFTGNPISGGAVDTFYCGPVYLSIQQSLTSIQNTLSGLSLSGLTSDFATLQTDLKGNFTSLSGGISTLTASLATLQTDLKGNFTSLTTGIGTLTSDLSADYASLSGSLSTLSTSLTNGFSTVESDLSGISTQLTAIQTQLSNLANTPQLVSEGGSSTLTPLSTTSTIFTSSSTRDGSVTVTLNTSGVTYRDSVTVRFYTDPSNPSFYVQQTVTFGGDTALFTTGAVAWKVQIVASFYTAGTITVNWAYSAMQPPP